MDLALSLLTILGLTCLGSMMGALTSSSWEMSSLLLLLIVVLLPATNNVLLNFLKNAFVHDAAFFCSLFCRKQQSL